MTSTIRAGEPRELLALIPHQLGFVPVASAVLVSLREPRKHVGLIARVDLDDLADRALGPQLARSLVAHLDSDGAVGYILVCYLADASPEPARDNGAVLEDAAALGLPQVRAALTHFTNAAGEFFPLCGAWVVDEQSYHVLDEEFLTRGPGRPVTDLQASVVGAHMVAAGSVVRSRRQDLAQLPEISQVHRRRAVLVAEEWRRPGLGTDHEAPRSGEDSGAPQGGHRPPKDRMLWRVRCLRQWRTEVDRVASGPGDARARPSMWGRIAAGLDDVVVRDAVLLSLVSGVGTLPEKTLVTSNLEVATSEAIARIVDPVLGLPPDPRIVEPSNIVLRNVAAHVRGRAASLTLLALLAWWEGKGAEAGEWLVQALETDPFYRLAGLLVQAHESGMPPGWVRSGLR